MRLVNRVSFLVVCVCGAGASSARADMSGTFSNSYGTTGGGEFLFTSTGDHDGLELGSFLTFCLERNEHLDYESTFTVVGIDTAAYSGGVGGGNPDPLDEKTAWLYQSFRDGSLADWGYDYSTARTHVYSANALQRVFWGIEGEFGDDWTPARGLQQVFYSAAVRYADGLGDVRVLNIEWPDGTRAQSQLVLVPLPGSVLLGAIGMAGVGFVRRRFS